MLIYLIFLLRCTVFIFNLQHLLALSIQFNFTFLLLILIFNEDHSKWNIFNSTLIESPLANFNKSSQVRLFALITLAFILTPFFSVLRAYNLLRIAIPSSIWYYKLICPSSPPTKLILFFNNDTISITIITSISRNIIQNLKS